MVWRKELFCHRGKSELFVHELAQRAFDLTIMLLSKAFQSREAFIFL